MLRGMRSCVLPCLLVLALGCVSAADPSRYRLTGSADWRASGSDPVLEELRPRYAAFFDVVLDATQTQDLHLLPLRDDLERDPTDRHAYDALNAVAVAYFELNARAEGDRGGDHYLADSFRAAKLLAVPWRAYGEIEDPALRVAILEFFEDAASDVKPHAATTSPRLTRIVASLEPKEADAARLARIRALVARLEAREPPAADPF